MDKVMDVEADKNSRRTVEKFLIWKQQSPAARITFIMWERISDLTLPVNSDLETYFCAGASRLAIEYG